MMIFDFPALPEHAEQSTCSGQGDDPQPVKAWSPHEDVAAMLDPFHEFAHDLSAKHSISQDGTRRNDAPPAGQCAILPFPQAKEKDHE